VGAAVAELVQGHARAEQRCRCPTRPPHRPRRHWTEPPGETTPRSSACFTGLYDCSYCLDKTHSVTSGAMVCTDCASPRVRCRLRFLCSAFQSRRRFPCLRPALGNSSASSSGVTVAASDKRAKDAATVAVSAGVGSSAGLGEGRSAGRYVGTGVGLSQSQRHTAPEIKRQVAQGGPGHVPLRDPPRVVMRPFRLERPRLGSQPQARWPAVIRRLRHARGWRLRPNFENCDLFDARSPDTGRGVHARSWRANRDADVRR